MKSEVIEAIKLLAKEKEISEEALFNTIEEALKAAYKKNLPKGETAPNNLDVSVNRSTGAISLMSLITSPMVSLMLPDPLSLMHV